MQFIKKKKREKACFWHSAAILGKKVIEKRRSPLRYGFESDLKITNTCAVFHISGIFPSATDISNINFSGKEPFCTFSLSWDVYCLDLGIL